MSRIKEIIKLTPLRVTLASVFSASFAPVVMADEGGVAFWFSGQYASFAAVPATPGWSIPAQGYYYNGSAAKSKTLPRGNVLSGDVDSSLPVLIVQPTYSPHTKLWDGQLSFGLGFGWGSNTTSADIAISDPLLLQNEKDTVTGMTDLYPVVSLAWNNGNDNWMTYLTGDIPTGDYNASSLSNLGIGHGAVDLGGGYTYFNETTGRELSAVLGFTYNIENDDTNYQNGIDVHLDWGVSQFLNQHWQIGIVGYVYGQITADSGDSVFADDIKSSIAAVGPEIGYSFTMNNQAAYINLRGYWEFAAKHRVEGGSAFVTLSLPL
ncbi:SphA family protein [Colwellia echini]|uniref:Phenol degradation protein meta n=1 Tax=Colwellia echini TaxID=1982103 RepID=A0ABY3MVQ3_9GAMM|nr:transporter [Colwellia echini]TYK65288.1 phenol degradation protein meta [Colwellia echini]